MKCVPGDEQYDNHYGNYNLPLFHFHISLEMRMVGLVPPNEVLEYRAVVVVVI